MHAKYLLVHYSSYRQTIEAVGEGLPQLNVVPTFALVVEAIYSVNTSTFVIATKNEKIFGILDLICQQKADGFETLFSPINVVAEKQVVGGRRKAPVFEKSQEIKVLTMDIPTDLYILIMM